MIFQIKPWPLLITKGKSNDRVRGFQVNFYLGAFRPNGNRFCPTKWLLPRDSGHQTTAERDSGPFFRNLFFISTNFYIKICVRENFPRCFWNWKKVCFAITKKYHARYWTLPLVLIMPKSLLQNSNWLWENTEKVHVWFIWYLGGHYIVVSVISGMTIISDMTTISGTVHTVWSMVLELPLKMPLQLKISTWTYPL